MQKKLYMGNKTTYHTNLFQKKDDKNSLIYPFGYMRPYFQNLYKPVEDDLSFQALCLCFKGFAIISCPCSV